MKTLRLPDIDLAGHPMVHVNGQPRHATATAVGFLGKNTVVAGHFLGRRLFAIDIDSGEVIAEAEVPGHVDLLDVLGDRVATANFPYKDHESSASFFWWTGSEFVLKSHIRLPGLQPHSVRLDPYDPNLAMVCSTNDASRLVALRLDRAELGGDSGPLPRAPKDCAMLDAGMVVVWAKALPGTDVKDDRAFLELRNKSDGLAFNGMPDCIAVDHANSRLYVTLQDRHEVLCVDTTGGVFTEVGRIGGLSFPHGCAFAHSMLAVSNYGTNTVTIFNHDDLP